MEDYLNIKKSCIDYHPDRIKEENYIISEEKMHDKNVLIINIYLLKS